MRSKYKKLGQYIKEVNIRNTDLKVERLLGVSVKKVFIPSIANTVGTNFKSYKTVKKNQFVYIADTSRRGDKIGLALLEDYDIAIVSQAYTVFEIRDIKLLDPEYLMMWFRRTEFDRYARFKSHGSVREAFDWDEMCDVKLPVPSIETQRAIVAEYNTVQNRIHLNEQLIQKLEETAQTIYREWFVEFEFPDENGKPYKSNGGEMIESEIGEIPKDWEINEITSICDITSSKRIFEKEYKKKGIPFYRGKEITLKKSGEVISDLIYISVERYNELIKSYGKPSKGDILMTAVGTIGSSYMVDEEEFYFKDGNVIWFKNFKQKDINFFLYDFMQTDQFSNIINEITIGSTQSAITIKTFGQQKLVFPEDRILKRYINFSTVLNYNLNIKKKEKIVLNTFKDLLLSKLAANKN